MDIVELRAALAARVAGEVRFDRGTLSAYAQDASNYRQVPIGVVVPRTVDAGAAAVAVCREAGAPVLSRGGGTSLAGLSATKESIWPSCSRSCSKTSPAKEDPMSIWRNPHQEESAGEPPAAAERDSGSPGEAAADNGEPAPAFRRAQGRQPAPGYGRDQSDVRAPAGTPRPGYGQIPAETGEPAGAPAGVEDMESAGAPAAAATREPETPAPAMTEAPAGTDAPAPVLAEKVVVIDEETAVKEQAGATAGTVSPAAASPAGDAAAASHGGISAQRWSEIMATFVDDPRGSVKMAADAVDTAIEELVASVRARQQALASSWPGSGTDTEQLRTALREYRRFGAQVQQLSPAEPVGRQRVAGG